MVVRGINMEPRAIARYLYVCWRENGLRRITSRSNNSTAMKNGVLISFGALCTDFHDRSPQPIDEIEEMMIPYRGSDRFFQAICPMLRGCPVAPRRCRSWNRGLNQRVSFFFLKRKSVMRTGVFSPNGHHPDEFLPRCRWTSGGHLVMKSTRECSGSDGQANLFLCPLGPD